MIAANADVRPLEPRDAAELASLYTVNRSFLAPFEPIRDDDFFTAGGQCARLQRLIAERLRGIHFPFAIMDDAAIVGAAFLGPIAYGAFRSGQISGWVSETQNGRGLATAALGHVIRFAFDDLELHRIEVGTLTDNLASQRVLEHHGLHPYGLAPRLVQIAGAWRDHLLFQLTAEEYRADNQRAQLFEDPGDRPHASPLAALARHQAVKGLEEQCRASCTQALRLGPRADLPSIQANTLATLGLLELGLGRPRRAAEHLDETHRLCLAHGQLGPNAVHHPDRVEAHHRAGTIERARAALADFEAVAHGTDHPSTPAHVARCHGMLDDDFDPWFALAYATHDPSESPFEQARTELCHGERLRRARRIREARGRLRSALDQFQTLGATPWAERARSELHAAEPTSSRPRAAVTHELTPREFDVALAIAHGATNREVASALYVSPKTVEVRLTQIYRKLGLRSRTELARLLLTT